MKRGGESSHVLLYHTQSYKTEYYIQLIITRQSQMYYVYYAERRKDSQKCEYV